MSFEIYLNSLAIYYEKIEKSELSEEYWIRSLNLFHSPYALTKLAEIWWNKGQSFSFEESLRLALLYNPHFSKPKKMLEKSFLLLDH